MAVTVDSHLRVGSFIMDNHISFELAELITGSYNVEGISEAELEEIIYNPF